MRDAAVAVRVLGLGVRKLRRLDNDDGWVHEADVEEELGRVWLGRLIRADLVEMRHTRPARPGDQGFTVWYRPKETT